MLLTNQLKKMPFFYSFGTFFFSIVLLLLLTTITVTDGIDIGQSIKDTINQVASGINKAVDSIGNTACIVNNREEFDQCNKRMEDYVNKDKVEKAEMKVSKQYTE